MDVQTASPPYMENSSGQNPVSGSTPSINPPIPGLSSGLPAQGGLSVLANPMAEQLRSMGRGEDSMLVHMTPNEVNSLQGLARAAGGSLSINPDTGLPEAGFLSKILPTLLGVGLNFILPGSGLVAQLGGKALTAGLLTAAGTTAVTGSLQRGLMAGLGAYGGASLAGGIQGAIGGAARNAATAATSPATVATTSAASPAATGASTAARAATSFSPTQAMGVSPQFASAGAQMPAALGGGAALPSFPALPAASAAPSAPALQRGLGGFMQGFANTARGTMSGLGASMAVPMAASGVLGTVSSLTTPSGSGEASRRGAVDNSYTGPYTAQRREAQFAPSTADILGSSAERDYFAVDTPEIYDAAGQLVQPGSETAPGTPIVQNVLNPRARKGQPMYSQRITPYMGLQPDEGYAKGGTVSLADGAFVVDARTVSELGNGSSNAGQEVLARLGGRPIRGPGDGVSDSVPARIGRDQPARVARDEVVFPPEAVRRLGRGNEQRGADKLYSLMDKAHKARRRSERGKDTGLRRGLA